MSENTIHIAASIRVSTASQDEQGLSAGEVAVFKRVTDVLAYFDRCLVL